MKYLLSAATWDEFLRSGMCQLELIPLADKYDCAGIEFRPYWRSTIDELPAIKEFLAEYGLISTYACGDCLLSHSEDFARKGFQAAEQSLNLAEFLGSTVLQVNLAAEPFNLGLLQAEWWQDELRKLISQAEKKGILIAVQNIPHSWGGDPTFMLELVSFFNSAWFKAAFDSGNWLAAGWDPGLALDILERYIGYVHLKDMLVSQGGYSSCLPGMGIIDILGLIGRLNRSGYQGYCALELPGGKSPAASVKVGLQFLRQEIG